MIFLAIILIIVAVVLIGSSLLPSFKESIPSKKSENTLKTSAETDIIKSKDPSRKKIPVGLMVLGILWMLNGLYIGFNGLVLLFLVDAKPGIFTGFAIIFIIFGIGWIIIGVGLIKRDALSRKIGLIAAGLTVLLSIIFIAVPPITQEEYQKQQYEQHRRYQQYQKEMYGVEDRSGLPISYPEVDRPTKFEVDIKQTGRVINILVALIGIFYLMTPGVKRYFILCQIICTE